jgi:hypothetical protein
MGSKLKIRGAARALRAHVVIAAIILSVLLGAGLRLVPTSDAAAAGSNAAGEGAASTACAAP